MKNHERLRVAHNTCSLSHTVLHVLSPSLSLCPLSFSSFLFGIVSLRLVLSLSRAHGSAACLRHRFIVLHRCWTEQQPRLRKKKQSLRETREYTEGGGGGEVGVNVVKSHQFYRTKGQRSAK